MFLEGLALGFVLGVFALAVLLVIAWWLQW
jgi:hypothetical protein